MRRRRSLGCFVLATTVLGCNAIAGINDPTPRNDVARFVGTWQTSRTIGYLRGCRVEGAFPVDEVSMLVVEKGDGPGKIVIRSDDDQPCALRFTVDGEVASAEPGERCTFFDAVNGITSTYSYVSPTTFTINFAGTAADTSFTAGVVFEPAGVACEFSSPATTYTKLQ